MRRLLSVIVLLLTAAAAPAQLAVKTDVDRISIFRAAGKEPILEQVGRAWGNPLLQFENVILTPHSAGVDVQSLGDTARSAAETVVSLRRGEWPAEKIVNPEVRASFRW